MELYKIAEQKLNYFKFSENTVRIYLHYRVLVWHLHIHFAHVFSNYLSGNNIYLNDIIQNLELEPNYYQKIILEYRT